MNKIDTDYTSLDQLDPEIVRFYEEEVRERVVGYTDPDNKDFSTPITESYTVVVLSKPEEVSFDYVESRRGRRLGEDVAKAALVKAIAWNDFVVNHDEYLSWKDDHEQWEVDQPTELIGEDEVLLPEPERPVVDISDQRAVYEKVTRPFDTTLFNQEGFTVEYNDESFYQITIPTIVSKPTEEIASYHSELAVATRHNAVYAPLPFGDNFIDVGRGKDGVLGIDNVKDTIAGYAAGMTGIGSVMWIMTDNSVEELTIDDLNQVIVDFNTRKQLVFMEYSQWREGDRLTKFEVAV